MRGEWLVTPQNVRFAKLPDDRNIAFTSLWDNWPRMVSVPVNAAGGIHLAAGVRIDKSHAGANRQRGIAISLCRWAG